MEGIILALGQNDLLRPEPTLYPILQIITFIVETCVVPVGNLLCSNAAHTWFQ